jgi:hypothetical protein
LHYSRVSVSVINWEKQKCQDNKDKFVVDNARKVPITYAIKKTSFLKSLKAMNPT